MDKNSIIGIVLIAAILIVWGIVNSPSKEEQEAQRRMVDSLNQAQELVTEPLSDESVDQATVVEITPGATQEADSLQLNGAYGAFAAAVKGEDAFYTLENDLVRLVVSNKGGRPYSAEVKQYMTFNRDPVILFDGDSTLFGFNFYHRNKPITTNDLYFSSMDGIADKVVQDRSDSLVLRMTLGPGQYIEYRYVLEPESYMVDFNVAFVGLQDIVDRSVNSLDLFWDVYAIPQEQLKKNENYYTTIYYRHFNEDVAFLNARTNKDQEENIPTQVQWVAFRNQFFSSVLINESGFSNAFVRSTMLPEDEYHLKNFRAEMGLPFSHGPSETLKMKMFFGPNKYNLLRKYDDLQLEDVVSVGKNLIRWINQFVIIPIFDWLSRFIGNYGIIILLLTLIIKIGLLPLTYRSYLSQAKMRVLKPQIDEINKKYPKGKEMEKQQATMALYKKAGVSPLGGCLPMLLQFPILFAMFRFFPTSIELRQEAFLWVKDLSTYDSILSWNATIPILSNIYGNHISLFTLLMTVSTILSMKMSDTSATSQQMPGMKGMMYVMPVMFMFVLNNYSAGLTYYYFLANVITIGQNYLFKQFIDEKEILRKIEVKKAKPAQKSKFQQRLEEMAKQSGYKVPKKK